MKHDIKEVWEYCNPDGELYRFARLSNQCVKTLAYLGNVISDRLLRKQQMENSH